MTLGRDVIFNAVSITLCTPKERCFFSLHLPVFRPRLHTLSPHFCNLSSLFPYCIQHDVTSQRSCLSIGFQKSRPMLLTVTLKFANSEIFRIDETFLSNVLLQLQQQLCCLASGLVALRSKMLLFSSCSLI